MSVKNSGNSGGKGEESGHCHVDSNINTSLPSLRHATQGHNSQHGMALFVTSTSRSFALQKSWPARVLPVSCPWFARWGTDKQCGPFRSIPAVSVMTFNKSTSRHRWIGAEIVRGVTIIRQIVRH